MDACACCSWRVRSLSCYALFVVDHAGAKEKGGERQSPWGPALTGIPPDGVDCKCKSCGAEGTSKFTIKNAKWRMYNGELVCPPHCGTNGDSNCQAPLKPTERGRKQLADLGLVELDVKEVNTKTLNQRKQRGKL